MRYTVIDWQGYVLFQVEQDAEPDVNERVVEGWPPEPGLRWDAEFGEWARMPFDAGAARRARWAYLKTQRANREGEGFVWDGHRFATDPDSIVRLQTHILAGLVAKVRGHEDWTLVWQAADNQQVTLTTDDLMQLAETMAAHFDLLHQAAQTLRARLGLAQTQAEIDAVAWP